MDDTASANGGSAGPPRKVTRRERFLALMGGMMPWAQLVEAIAAHDAVVEARAPLDPERMLRLYFVQRWYALSDEGLEDALHDMASLRRFVGIELGVDALPRAAETVEFRRRLEANRAAGALLDEVDRHLIGQGLRIQPGAIVEATIGSWSLPLRGAGRLRGRSSR